MLNLATLICPKKFRFGRIPKDFDFQAGFQAYYPTSGEKSINDWEKIANA